MADSQDRQRSGAHAPSRGVPYGRYQLLEKVGEGGMAAVYLAEMRGAEGFAKRVALKLMKQTTDIPPEFNKQFISEARLGGFLSHPNIVETMDFGEQEGRLFLAMEYMDGPSLDKVISLHRTAERPLPLDVCLAIIIDVCHGLEHAHRACDHQSKHLAIIHRDLKPSNILLSRYGQAKIADFGVARARSNLVKTRVAGLAKGTARYMSPEQAWGLMELDHRSDLFSVGLILYELITLKPMYDGQTKRELLRRAQDADVVPSLQKLPEMPLRSTITQVLLRMLSREPSDRYSTADEIARVLLHLHNQLGSHRSLRDWFGEAYQQMVAEGGRGHTYALKEEEPPPPPVINSPRAILRRPPVGDIRPPVETDALEVQLAGLASSEWTFSGKLSAEPPRREVNPEDDTEVMRVSPPPPEPPHAAAPPVEMPPPRKSRKQKLAPAPAPQAPDEGPLVEHPPPQRPPPLTPERLEAMAGVAEATTQAMRVDRDVDINNTSDSGEFRDIVKPVPATRVILLSVLLAAVALLWWVGREEEPPSPARRPAPTAALPAKPPQPPGGESAPGTTAPGLAPPAETDPEHQGAAGPGPLAEEPARPAEVAPVPTSAPTPAPAPTGPPRAPAAPAAETWQPARPPGHVKLNARPPASVQVDGEPTGNTRTGPIELELSEGYHDVVWTDPNTDGRLETRIKVTSDGRLTCVAYFDAMRVECR